MNDFYKELQKRILVCDGAMGTMLQEKGLKAGDVPEIWNIEKPRTIFDVHKSYIDAGADIIITNTFGASGYKLGKIGLDKKIEYINKKGAEIALKAASDKVYVFADIGPSGRLLEPYGDIKKHELYENYKQQVLLLKETGICGFIVETMSDINELEICIKAIKENTDLPFISSMTFNKIKDDTFKTMMGVSIKDMIEKIHSLEGKVIGTNCGNGSKEMLDILKLINKQLSNHKNNIFIIAQPNAGVPVVDKSKTYFSETPEDFKKIIPKYLEAGINIIGGCCGTTPKHIKVIKNLID